MTYTPQIGHTILVHDAVSAYHGREAVVTSATVYADVVVYTVGVREAASRGGVSFALTRDKLRELKYGA